MANTPSLSDFRPGPPPGPFSRWLLSLTPGVIYPVPRRFEHIATKNVSGPNAAIRSAGRRARFRRHLDGKRYVYVEEIT